MTTKLFASDTPIQSSTNSERYQLKDTVKLSGVYNVNQGYAVFKRIEILYENDDYCIVSKDTANGLSAYDHIALIGKTAVDQQIIY
jgi:23S rRNA-/tRNA-specific pseudouridylate synthase